MARNDNKINLPTNTTDIRTLAKYLKYINERGLVSRDVEQEVFAQVKIQESRKNVTNPAKDTHTKSTLKLFGLIDVDEDESFSVSLLGKEVLNYFSDENSYTEEDRIALMLKVLCRWEINDKYGRHIHPGFIMMKLLCDSDLDYYITNHELSHFTMSPDFKFDEQYSEIKQYILDFRNQKLPYDQDWKRSKSDIFLSTFDTNWGLLTRTSRTETLSDRDYRKLLTQWSANTVPENEDETSEDDNNEDPEEDTSTDEKSFIINECRFNGLAAYVARLYLSLLEGVEVRDYLSYFGSSRKNNKTIKSEQIIYFGAPGTGKSFKVEHREGETEADRIRTTFHPDTDYSSFVGCYKPMQDEDDSKRIVYKFEGQCFAKAYVEAWKRLVDCSEGQNINFTLIIEEINRGNCAQIFGDIFQLLDRRSNGFSQYAIQPDEDLSRYIFDEFNRLGIIEKLKDEGHKKIALGKEMKLPPNLSIIATMNTSDQSLFPIDSAFKRRWDWEYIPIQYKPINEETKQPITNKIDIDGTIYDWGEFIEKLNEKIYGLTKSEDKELGYFFVRPDNGKNISMQRFVSKVIFYLWSDIYKDYVGRDNSIFKFSEDGEEKNKKDHSFNSFFKEKKINDFLVKKFIEQFVKPENSDGSQKNDEIKLAINGKEIIVKLSGTNGGKSVAEALELLTEEQIVKLFNSDYNQSPILNGRCKIIDDHKLPETDPNEPAISDYSGYKSMQWQIGSYNYYIMTYVTSKRREYFEKFSEILGEDVLKIENP